MAWSTWIKTMTAVAWVGLIGCDPSGAPADNDISETKAAINFQDQADFDGDGKPDLLWHNGATGQSQIWFMNGVNRNSFGNLDINIADSSGWKPVAINYFNLDGSEDIVWHNGITGDTQFWFMNGTTRIGFANLNPSFNFTDSSGWKIVASRPHNLLRHNGQTGVTEFWSYRRMGRHGRAFRRSIPV